MSEPELIDVKWMYYLGAAIVALCSAIAGMARYFAKERINMGEQYAALNIELLKALDRIGDHLRDLYNKDSDDRASRTHFSFTLNDKDKKR